MESVPFKKHVIQSAPTETVSLNSVGMAIISLHTFILLNIFRLLFFHSLFHPNVIIIFMPVAHVYAVSSHGLQFCFNLLCFRVYWWMRVKNTTEKISTSRSEKEVCGLDKVQQRHRRWSRPPKKEREERQDRAQDSGGAKELCIYAHKHCRVDWQCLPEGWFFSC